MCGIVGAAARRNVVPMLIEGLKQLEYRGHDSAGLAVLAPQLSRIRASGRVAELERRVGNTAATTGIAHTRWATHGEPAERNAHPHACGHVAVVHKDIIEHHVALREHLASRGYRFQSDTATEVIAHLLHKNMQGGRTLYAALADTVTGLHRSYAITAVSEREAGSVVGTRKGAPLLIGLGPKQNLFASDAAALIQVTDRVVHLDDGDIAELTARRVQGGTGIHPPLPCRAHRWQQRPAGAAAACAAASAAGLPRGHGARDGCGPAAEIGEECDAGVRWTPGKNPLLSGASALVSRGQLHQDAIQRPRLKADQQPGEARWIFFGRNHSVARRTARDLPQTLPEVSGAVQSVFEEP